MEFGAQRFEVQRVLGHTRLSTTGIDFPPREDEVQMAVGRAEL
jgi:hypothetical protein